jgi:hypothetical protein
MSFLETLYCFFSGQDSSVLKEKRVLKRIAKEISQSKYRRFYKSGSGEINPAFGSFFYDMYKILAPARNLIQNAEKSSLLKQLVIEAFMDKDLQEVHKRLFPETIMEQAKSVQPQELSSQLEQDLEVFSSAFSTNQMHLVDQSYNLIMTFKQLASFDFFSLLKKMDPRLREQDFAYQPQFRRIPGKYLGEKIKDFLELPLLEAKWDEWKTIFEILKQYKKGIEVVNLNQWKKLVSSILDVQKSDIMVLMIRHIDMNINWQKNLNFDDAEYAHEYMVESYIKAKNAEVHACIDKIIHDNRASKRDALANALFGATNITRLQYYTNSNNEIYLKKNLEGFIYTDALNYLKAFIVDYKDMREVCDLFLIRGQWASQTLSRQMSQELHQIADIAEQLANFDASLADGGRNGSKLKSHLIKAGDRNQVSYIKTILGTINEEAGNMITDAISSFTTVGTHLKELYADYEKKPHPKIIVNWKEIESVSEIPIDQRIQKSCKSINSFVYLMQLFF